MKHVFLKKAVCLGAVISVIAAIFFSVGRVSAEKPKSESTFFKLFAQQVVAQPPNGPIELYKWYDARQKVVCWGFVFDKEPLVGISCLPLNQLENTGQFKDLE